MGCDGLKVYILWRNQYISIHAPTWGATLSGIPDIIKTSISIHAPTWGATIIARGDKLVEPFQSTHPHGVRPRVRSIDNVKFPNFNPRTHMGCDRGNDKLL